MRRRRFDPWVGKIPWRMESLPTPLFLPGKSHGLCTRDEKTRSLNNLHISLCKHYGWTAQFLWKSLSHFSMHKFFVTVYLVILYLIFHSTVYMITFFLPCPYNCKLLEGLSLFGLPLYPQSLTKCLIQTKFLIKLCWLNEWKKRECDWMWRNVMRIQSAGSRTTQSAWRLSFRSELLSLCLTYCLDLFQIRVSWLSWPLILHTHCASTSSAR